MKLNVLAAAALAAACLCTPALAADPPTTALPLSTPGGTVFNEATWFDGAYYWPKPILNGWTGTAAKPLSLDGNGNPSVTVLNPLTGFATATAQATANGSLATIATNTAGLALHSDALAIIAALGTPLQAGGAVTVSNLPGTQPVSAAALPLPAGAATSAKQDALLTALGTPLQAGGSVTVAGGPTAAGQTTANGSLTSIAANTTPAGTGSMAAVPTGSTNGTALGCAASSFKGARFYLGTADSVTFTVATSAPSSAPASTYTISGATSGTGPNWDENLGGTAAIYVTAKAGAPLFRCY